MESRELERAVGRVAAMERIFDILRAAAAGGTLFASPVQRALLGQLLTYYEGGQWRRDYELDEAGLLPAGLKRGVLSQDGVYDFLQSLESEGGSAV